MQNYLAHLLSDIEAAILRRWQQCPPHYYQMGLPDRYLEPPTGWDGPPFGYARNDDALNDFFAELEQEDVLSDPLPPDETPLPTMETEAPNPDNDLPPDPEFMATIEEVETYLHGKPELSMFYHFSFDAAQFPPPEKLTDDELNMLTLALCRLWAAYNFTPVFPQAAPGRVVYPLLLERMGKPAFVFDHGHVGVEFCHYEPEDCPFGAWCDCGD
jgi:hypothetical protein